MLVCFTLPQCSVLTSPNPGLHSRIGVTNGVASRSTTQCKHASHHLTSPRIVSCCFTIISVLLCRHGSIQLLPEEKNDILTLLPAGTNEDEKEAVINILSQLNTRVSAEEDISDQDQVKQNNFSLQLLLLSRSLNVIFSFRFVLFFRRCTMTAPRQLDVSCCRVAWRWRLPTMHASTTSSLCGDEWSTASTTSTSSVRPPTSPTLTSMGKYDEFASLYNLFKLTKVWYI